MIVTLDVASPLGPLLLAAKDGALVGLWLEGQKYFGGVYAGGHPYRDPLRRAHHLRCYRQGSSTPLGAGAYVCPSCGRRSRTQSHLYHHPLPPRRRVERQPHRLCRRHRQEAHAPDPRGRGYTRALCAQEKHSAVNGTRPARLEQAFFGCRGRLGGHMIVWYDG